MGQYFQGVVVDLEALEARVARRDPDLIERMQAPKDRYSARLLGAEQTRRALDEILAGAISRGVDGDYYGLAVLALAYELGTRTGAPDVTLQAVETVKGFDELYPYVDADRWPLGIPATNFVLGASYGPERCAEVLAKVRSAQPNPPSAEELERDESGKAAAVFAVLKWLQAAVDARQSLLLCHM